MTVKHLHNRNDQPEFGGGKGMAIRKDTLQAMIRDYHGFELSDEELELVRPELDNYLQEVENLRALDLADVLSARLLRAQEGEQR
jgi:hypothetical protein